MFSSSVQSDFYLVPVDEMSYSHTWRQRNDIRRGLAVLSEDSKEEESDRERAVEGRRSQLREETVPLGRRVPRRLVLIILVSIVLGLVGIAFHRYQSALFPSPSKKTVLPEEKPSSSRSNPLPPPTVSRIPCTSSTLLSHNEEGQYFYAVEATIPLSFNETFEAFEFYQAFSATGKPLESPIFWELPSTTRRDEEGVTWRAEKAGNVAGIVSDYFQLTIFLENTLDKSVTRRSFSVHSPEMDIRRQLEEEAELRGQARRDLDGRLIQALICSLSFVLGLFVARFVPSLYS